MGCILSHINKQKMMQIADKGSSIWAGITEKERLQECLYSYKNEMFVAIELIKISTLEKRQKLRTLLTQSI